MLYESSTRVIHVNDVAGVPRMMVKAARAASRSWVLHTLPPASVSPSALVARTKDALPWFRGRGAADILHVHYAPNGYYFWGAKAKKVLHFHGTDLRIDLHQPVKRQLILESVRQADLVAFSTPDLADAARAACSDAIYLPNPAPAAPANPLNVVPGRVIFNARWDDSKGGVALVDAARTLVCAGLEVLGFDWGTYRQQARNAGVRMLPLTTVAQFGRTLTSAQVIVGQVGYQALTISDMQALSANRPLVTMAPKDTPVVQATPENLAAQVQLALNGETLSPTERADWVQAHHGQQLCLRAWENAYAKIA